MHGLGPIRWPNVCAGEEEELVLSDVSLGATGSIISSKVSISNTARDGVTVIAVAVVETAAVAGAAAAAAAPVVEVDVVPVVAVGQESWKLAWKSFFFFFVVVLLLLLPFLQKLTILING